MILSNERLRHAAIESGFRPEILEKVIILMQLLDLFNKDAFLKERLVLKGGTALNLFYFGLPRLSVDIDLNYIGALEREIMLLERPEVENRIENICQKLGFKLARKPNVHAGGKLVWRYPSVLGNQGNIEIDLNFIYRVPLLAIKKKSSPVLANQQAENIAVLDIHELAAGKLSALFDRAASRDIFDAHHLLCYMNLDKKLLRQLFILYSGMSRKSDLRIIEPAKLQYDVREFQNRLLPVLNRKVLGTARNMKNWVKQLFTECQNELAQFFPLSDNEHAFLAQLLEKGEIVANLICNTTLAKKARQHPALLWVADRTKLRG